MAAACLTATRVQLDIVNGSGGYRDWDAQEYLYRHPPAGIKVAAPGKSTHGFGRALDLTTTCYTKAVEAWCRANCSAYGFTVPPANDPRHFQHNGLILGPILQTQGDDDVIIYKAETGSADGVIARGFAFIQEGSLGVLRPMSDEEFGAYEFWSTRGIPFRLASWDGEAIRTLSRTVGVMQMSGAPGNDPALTGKIIFADPAKADFPRVSGLSSAAVDQKPVLDAIAALAKALTPSTILERFREFWKTGK